MGTFFWPPFDENQREDEKTMANERGSTAFSRPRPSVDPGFFFFSLTTLLLFNPKPSDTPVTKIKVANPVVDLDGDEMTR